MRYRELKIGKGIKILFAGILLIALGIGCVLLDRENERKTGTAQGYAAGYSIGYTDYMNGLQQISSKLASEVVPYEAGTGEWKYFIMGFVEGYEDAQTGEYLWYTDAS